MRLRFDDESPGLAGDLRWTRQCLYVKAYCERAAQNRLLARLIPVVRRFDDDPKGRGFFFIRYSDPGNHLRLRFLARRGAWDREALLAEVKRAASFRPDIKLRKSVYRPEVDRYGGPVGIRLAEGLFAADSALVLSCLRPRSGKPGSLGPVLALATLELMFSSLGVGRPLRRDFFKHWAHLRCPRAPAQTWLRQELDGADTDVIKELARRADDGSRAIARLVWPQGEDALAAFCRTVGGVGTQLRRFRASLGKTLFARLQSYAHMHFNRFAIHGPMEVFMIRLRASIEP